MKRYVVTGLTVLLYNYTDSTRVVIVESECIIGRVANKCGTGA